MTQHTASLRKNPNFPETQTDHEQENVLMYFHMRFIPARNFELGGGGVVGWGSELHLCCVHESPSVVYIMML